MLAFPNEFATDIDVAGVRAHREAREQAALDQEMRIVPHNLAVLAGAGLGFIGIDHEIARPSVGRFFRHERPFQTRRKARPAPAAQAGGLHLADDPVAALVDDRLGAVPGATPARAFEAPILEAVEVLEDAILVVEHDFQASFDQRLDCMAARTAAQAPKASIHMRLVSSDAFRA